MSFNGWAVALNGVMVATCDADWDGLDCFPLDVLPVLDVPPEGLDLPGLRTEDVVYYQRDGVKHFSDWYEPRQITVQGTVGPAEICVDGDCSTVRQQVQDLIQAWKRSCCDTELVIFPDCYQTDLTTGLNVYPDGTFDVDTDGWSGDGATLARVTSPVHEGAGALQITWGTDIAGDENPSGPTFVGEPDTSYQVSGWLYADIGEPAPMLGVTDSLGTDPILSDPVTVDGSWHYVEVVWPVGSSGEIVPFVTSSVDTTSGDVVYLDSVEAKQINPNVNRDLNGPFGVIGRPRVFNGGWLNHDQQIYQFTARFDAVDQRMYVLDECGTPGYSECEQIDPGAQLFSLCEPVCGTGAGVCATTPVQDETISTPPVEITVGGTEKVNPTITLFPPLVSPRVENLTTGEYVQLDTTLTVDDTPVTINTEEGTAFDQDGNSLTHLLRGSLFLSMFPGIYTWRLIANGSDELGDPGYMTLCWRNTVVSA